jgi:MFS family permease
MRQYGFILNNNKTTAFAAMALYLTVLLSFFNTAGIKGSRIVLALYALHLDASAVEIGFLVATYAALPLMVAMYAGRISDQFGVRWPMMLASMAMAIGLLVPALGESLWWLALSGTILGVSNVFFHVACQNLVGAIGGPAERTANFSTFSLGGSVSGVAGPVLAGFAVEHGGYLVAYALLAVIAIIPAICLLFYHAFIPAMIGVRRQDPAPGGLRELIAIPPLRNALLTSGLILTGLDLFNFYMPIFGRSIGLSASVIGIIVGAQAAAAFAVRIWMPAMVNRYSAERILVWSLWMSGMTYLLFPFIHNAAALIGIGFLLGLGLGCGQPLSTLLTYNYSPPNRVGEALGLRLAVNKVTQSGVPLIFGSLGSVFGIMPIFFCTGVLLMGGAYLTARHNR